MKWLLRLGIIVVMVVAAAFAAGASVPRDHSASIRFALPVPAESVHVAIADVERSADWRTGVTVQVLENEPLTWKETSEWGALTFVRDPAETPGRLVHRIVDTGEPFGGVWTFDVASSTDGTVVTITEDGWVSNPIFRLLSRFVFGHYSTMETYAHDLGTRFGVQIQPERVR